MTPGVGPDIPLIFGEPSAAIAATRDERAAICVLFRPRSPHPNTNVGAPLLSAAAPPGCESP